MTDIQATSNCGNLNMGAALATEGWHVEQRGEQTTVLDTDLAEHAGLSKPRDIHTTIAESALKDGAAAAAAELT